LKLLHYAIILIIAGSSYSSRSMISRTIMHHICENYIVKNLNGDPILVICRLLISLKSVRSFNWWAYFEPHTEGPYCALDFHWDTWYYDVDLFKVVIEFHRAAAMFCVICIILGTPGPVSFKVIFHPTTGYISPSQVLRGYSLRRR